MTMSASKAMTVLQRTLVPSATARIEAKVSEGLRETELLRKQYDRNNRLLLAGLTCGVLLAVGSVMYFYGLALFSAMPE
jgi:hypothetical protein